MMDKKLTNPLFEYIEADDKPLQTFFVGGDTGDIEYKPDGAPYGGNAYVVNWRNVEKPRGRPFKIDWQRMLTWLVAKAATDGLPQGRGARAEVIDWLQQWFIDNDLDASRSQIEEQVRLIYEEIEKHGK